MLPSTTSTSTSTSATSKSLAPHFRLRGISYIPVPDEIVIPIPETWLNNNNNKKKKNKLRLEIKASNATHYVFSAGPADAMSQMRTLLETSNEAVSWGFTGTRKRKRKKLLTYPPLVNCN